jgi:hypothetical protein
VTIFDQCLLFFELLIFEFWPLRNSKSTSKYQLQVESKGISFTRFQVKLHLLDFFEVEYYNEVCGSWFLIQFGYGLKILANQWDCCHLKDGVDSKSSSKGQACPLLWFLQVCSHFCDHCVLQGPPKNLKWLKCCEILDEPSQLSYFPLIRKKSPFWNILTRIQLSKMSIHISLLA